MAKYSGGMFTHITYLKRKKNKLEIFFFIESLSIFDMLQLTNPEWKPPENCSIFLNNIKEHGKFNNIKENGKFNNIKEYGK